MNLAKFALASGRAAFLAGGVLAQSGAVTEVRLLVGDTSGDDGLSQRGMISFAPWLSGEQSDTNRTYVRSESARLREAGE